MRNINEIGNYTNWPGRKTFIEERDMVKFVIKNEEDTVIRKYLEPLVLHLAQDFRRDYPETKLNNEEFLEAGFLHLDLGLRKYNERLETEKIGFKFSSYFEWFIRQGFLDYIKS